MAEPTGVSDGGSPATPIDYNATTVPVIKRDQVVTNVTPQVDVNPHVDVNNTVVTPTDRVRWGPIFAGLFAALSTLALLSLLGLAIGADNVDVGDRVREFGIGAGIWGAISTLLAFLVGGWVAARTSAVPGEGNGLLNGAMVWAVAIPLLLYLLSSGVGALLRSATDVATTGAQVAGQVADDANANAVPNAQATVAAGADNLQATAEALVTPRNAVNAAEGASDAAWGTLASLLFGLGAASLGGYLGARSRQGVRQGLDGFMG